MSATLELKLTQEQRQTIFKYAALPVHLSERITSTAANAKSISFTLDELDELLDYVQGSVYCAKGNERQKVIRITEKIAKMLGSDIRPEDMRKRGQEHGSNTVYQIKITLLGIEPPIWRRIQTRDCTLEHLHGLIQVTMGWEFDHAYSFTIGGREYLDPEMAYGNKFGDVFTARLSHLLPVESLRPRFGYRYDFGDDWEHQLIVEERFEPEGGATKYPICLAGQRACPPEDCGGSSGYAEKLEALHDPNHKWHDEIEEWMGDFDSERFDLEAVNARLSFRKEKRAPRLDQHNSGAENGPDGFRNARPVLVKPTQAETHVLAPMNRTVVVQSRAGRNDPCPCGSGKKFKHCCLRKPG